MHHDSRTYIELRYDTNNTDVVIVNFRDRGILPIETFTREFSIEAPEFTGDPMEELRSIMYKLMKELFQND